MSAPGTFLHVLDGVGHWLGVDWGWRLCCILVWLATIVWASAGYKVTTPVATSRALAARLDSMSLQILSNRLQEATDITGVHMHTDSETTQQTELAQRHGILLDGLTRLACLRESVRDLELAHIPCSDLLSGIIAPRLR